MCFLVGTLPNGHLFRHELGHERSTVGRLDLNTIRIEEESVSALHAELIPFGGSRFLLRDLRSTNGTLVEGRRISEEEVTAPCRVAFGRLDCQLEPCDSPECPLHGPEATETQQFADRATATDATLGRLYALESSSGDSAPEDSFERDLAECQRWASAGGFSLPDDFPRFSEASLRQLMPNTPEEASLAGGESPAPSKESLRDHSPVAAPGEPLFRIVLPKPPRPRKATVSTPVIPAAETTVTAGATKSPSKRTERLRKPRFIPSRSARHRPPCREKQPRAADSVLNRLKSLRLPPLDPHPALRQLAVSLVAPTGRTMAVGAALILTLAVALLQAGGALGSAQNRAESPVFKAVAPTLPPPVLVSATPAPAPAPIAEAPPVLPASSDVPAEETQSTTPSTFASIPPIAEPPEEPSGEPVLLASLSGAAGSRLNPSPPVETAPAPTTESAEAPPPAATVDLTPALQTLPETESSENGDAASGENAELSTPSDPQTVWEFAARSLLANEQWDVSAIAMLAANDWSIGLRQALDSSLMLRDLSLQAPWYLAAGSRKSEAAAVDLVSLGARREKPGMPVPHKASGRPPLSVMILGDSLGLCGFGSHLDHLFRESPNVCNTNTYMACGTVPMSWLKEGPYATVKTYCGFWTIESPTPGAKPVNFQDTYGMGKGAKPKPHPVPKLEDLMARAKPEVLIIQTGTNLYSLFRDGKTVQPDRHAPMLRGQIQPFLARLMKSGGPLRKIYWVAPPTSGRVSTEVQDFTLNQIREQVGAMATVIDSRGLVTYPYKHMEPDKEHFIGADMEQWADKVFEIVQNDLTAHPLPAALAAAPGFEPNDEGTSSKHSSRVASANQARENTPLRITARLVSKSQPFPILNSTYGDSLVSFLYDVVSVRQGECNERQIIVTHPAHIHRQPQPLNQWRLGKTYDLTLHELESTSCVTLKCADDLGLPDLQQYIQVKDEARLSTRDP